MKEEQKNSDKFAILNYLIVIAIILLVIILGIYFLNFHGSLSADKGDFGTFGDFVGGSLNPLLAFLSLIAIISTIKIQIQELELTRKELKITTEEMEKSRIAQEEQSEAFRIQNLSIKQQTFENTFFKLFEQHNTSLYLLKTNEKYIIDRIIYNNDRFLTLFIENNKGNLKSYFMLLYQILKFIDEQDRKFENEEFFNPKLYTNLIRITLENELLLLLAINCTVVNFNKFKELVEKYSFFEHFNPNSDEFISIPSLKLYDILSKFDTKVFGENEEIMKKNIYIMQNSN